MNTALILVGIGFCSGAVCALAVEIRYWWFLKTLSPDELASLKAGERAERQAIRR